MPILSPRSARARRAAQHWTDANAAHGCPLDSLWGAVAGVAEREGRDLTTGEVHEVCSGAVAGHLAAEVDAARRAAEAEAREQGRLAYLARVRARILAMRGPG